jgi:hypothetical protein
MIMFRPGTVCVCVCMTYYVTDFNALTTHFTAGPGTYYLYFLRIAVLLELTFYMRVVPTGSFGALARILKSTLYSD